MKGPIVDEDGSDEAPDLALADFDELGEAVSLYAVLAGIGVKFLYHGCRGKQRRDFIHVVAEAGEDEDDATEENQGHGERLKASGALGPLGADIDVVFLEPLGALFILNAE